MTAPVMEARGVVKLLGEGAGRVQALKGVDLTLHSGEMALLMGPSGSGKSTLVKVLLGLYALESGAFEGVSGVIQPNWEHAR